MGSLFNIVTPLHTQTKRDYLERMKDEKVKCMLEAKKYGQQYWDGPRRFGYGGYTFIPGRQTPIAQALVDEYHLTKRSSVLDIGCGKGILLWELQQLVPGITVKGVDISEYALENAIRPINEHLQYGRAEARQPFGDKQFDLVVSIHTLHNLKIEDLFIALPEIERIGEEAYICVESFRSELEQFNLQCWALTCETFLKPSSWIWYFGQCGYHGDYEFTFFE